MEVVLSPGRFGDEVPGVPFHNEEIREWSHVDRLTGMLERARVETGRWKTLNQGAARSYGKMVDSRERNSADGSVIQRARRQVEVFQSKGPGRSVQVVRASQWSSSRVTDFSVTNPLNLTSEAQKNDTPATEKLERVTSPRLNKMSPSSTPCRDEAISERLSTLLGSFAHHTSSSTVPLRRIDSKYSTRTPISLSISKRSTSNEDVVSHSEIHSGGLLAATRSLRDSRNKKCKEIKNKSKVPQQIRDSLINLNEDARHTVHEISVERDESRDYPERLREAEDSGTSDNSQSVIAIDEVHPTTSKAAIQLLPSNKANTTVVNLIKDSIGNVQTETMDIREGKRVNILNWVLPSSVVREEETTTTATTTTMTNIRREAKLDESVMPFFPERSVKRVGFCKTEIHFAADSGKVNIVETDGKPPPTNKFRRRRRNSLTGVSSTKNLPIIKLPVVETKDSLDQRIVENNKTRMDPNLHRGHTTTVNFGSDLSTKNERINKENSAPGVTGESMQMDINSSSHSALTTIESEHEASEDGCNVVCTDADNNQVFLKVVTTHEPTIARVESDHLRKKIKATANVPKSAKKERRLNQCPASTARKSESHKEHTYVNVFTGSKHVPIYENYKFIKPSPLTDNKIGTPLISDTNSVIEKSVNVADTTVLDSLSSNCSVLKSREFDNTNLETVMVATAAAAVNGQLSNGTELCCHVEDRLQVANKKARNKTEESKSFRTERPSCNITSLSSTPTRGRLGKQPTKNPLSKSSVSSSEKGSRLASRNKSSASKSTSHAAPAKALSKGDVLMKQKPIEVVYQTAVYNMKNEKLKKPQKEKESKRPRYLNELICGVKMKRPSDSKNGKTSNQAQHAANNKTNLQPMKHWK